jgi:hypothetical protein
MCVFVCVCCKCLNALSYLARDRAASAYRYVLVRARGGGGGRFNYGVGTESLTRPDRVYVVRICTKVTRAARVSELRHGFLPRVAQNSRAGGPPGAERAEF